MRRRREYDDTKISFTLTKAGCREGSPVEITGAEFDGLVARLRARKPKSGPLTKGQVETAELFVDFVRGGINGESQ